MQEISTLAATKSTPHPIRVFPTGASRDTDEGKFDYEGFLSPLVIERFGAYMHEHRFQPNGELRDSDNWQKGIPLNQYMKSGWRHFKDWWFWHRKWIVGPNKPTNYEKIEEALCATIFNSSGYLLEILKRKEKEEESQAVRKS